MLALRSVSKRYGSTLALDNVTLEIAHGEFFGLLGPNGAGKSTLMSLAAGLRQPDSGEISVAGRVAGPNDRLVKQSLGLVPQNIALYEDLTPVENLTVFGRCYGLHGSELNQRIDEALETVQLSDRRDDPIKTFSGGMLRRLNLVASQLHRPRLLLCDECTVGVDPQSRNAIFEYLKKLNREGITIIYSTHYMEEAERLCSRIGIIDHGKILALGTLDSLLTQLPFEDEISFPQIPATDELARQLKGEADVSLADGIYHLRPKAGYPLSRFFALTEQLGVSPRLFDLQRPSLEALFLHLTGRKLRD